MLYISLAQPNELVFDLFIEVYGSFPKMQLYATGISTLGVSLSQTL